MHDPESNSWPTGPAEVCRMTMWCSWPVHQWLGEVCLGNGLQDLIPPGASDHFKVRLTPDTGRLSIKSPFCLLCSHKYSINLQRGIRESKLNFTQGPNICRPLGPSKPPFLQGTPWKGDPGVCELYSFAQSKVFALKRKRLWLLLAIVLGLSLWAHLCQWLGKV